MPKLGLLSSIKAKELRIKLLSDEVNILLIEYLTDKYEAYIGMVVKDIYKTVGFEAIDGSVKLVAYRLKKDHTIGKTRVNFPVDGYSVGVFDDY